MIGHIAFEPEAAEPAIAQVQMHFLAKAALRADAEALADEQHPDHQLGVDRRPADLAAKRTQMRPDIREIDEPADGSRPMISRDVTLQAELVK